MNKVLSLLVSFVFLQTQAWALSGGPVYGTGSIDLTGTYAGVLIPSSNLPTLNEQGQPRATSIGLFSFASPQVGFATGVLVAFVDGTPIAGTMVGLIDPEDAHFQAVVDAQSTYSIVFDTNGDGTIDLTTPLQVTGNVDADIEATGVVGVLPGLNSARVQGTAGLDIFLFLEADGSPQVDQTVIFDVEGFKQSNDVTVATLPQFTVTPPGSGGTGGG